jgi:hypothetical protein
VPSSTEALSISEHNQRLNILIVFRLSDTILPTDARPVNQQRPQIDIAAFRDPPQAPSAPTGMLPGHQPQPHRKLAAVLEGVGIADRCH